MKIPKQYQFEHVCCLPKQLERKIMAAVRKNILQLILNNEEKQEVIENAHYSKVCDIEDTTYIKYIV